MVFNDASFLSIVVIVLAIWLAIMSVMVFRMIAHYNKLTSGISDATLKDVLTEFMRKHEDHTKDITSMKEALLWLQKDGSLHLQRIGIVRYNPFSDTGGSQSFSISILDGKDNGIVMTSLFARTGNRWYIKHIKNSRCEDVELSKEEQLAIKKARPIS